MERLRILALANKAWGTAPNQRFRFEQWSPHLDQDHEITIDLLPFESPELTKVLYKPGKITVKTRHIMRDFIRRGAELLKNRDYDAILVVREAALIGPAIYERIISWSGKPLIFDFDDSIWLQTQNSGSINGFFSKLHFAGKTRTICRLATQVSAGNPFLADYARRWNDNVTIVPTTIELKDYPVIAEAAPGPFVVCWTGSVSTLGHFNYAREALEEVAKQVPLTVKVICNRELHRPIQGANMQFVPWSPLNEAAEIANCHVGIMPLPEDDFTRGKCGLKALQYMATGRPVVISPVGVNVDIINDGENGFLARAPADFAKRLLELAHSPDLRRKLGKAARSTVEKEYSAERGASVFAKLLRNAVRPT